MERGGRLFVFVMYQIDACPGNSPVTHNVERREFQIVMRVKIKKNILFWSCIFTVLCGFSTEVKTCEKRA